MDQPDRNPSGSFTQNGLFIQAVRKFKEGSGAAEKVLAFEKLRDGIWVFNGAFELVGYTIDSSSGRQVFKFTLTVSTAEVIGTMDAPERGKQIAITDDDRIIPSWVKVEVWKRDRGRCIKCGAQDHLHFDHVIPYVRGGSSKDPANIQILCLRHNLQKRDKIE